MRRNRPLSMLPSGMDSRSSHSYASSIGSKGDSMQDWQRNASETLARGLEGPGGAHKSQRRRPSMPGTIRTVTPDPPESSDDFRRLNGSTTSMGYESSPTQTSPRSIQGGEKLKDRRQGLVFRDAYSSESLEAGRSGPPVSFHSRPRTRTMEDHSRKRSISSNVSTSRHRVGSVHSTNSSSLHSMEPRSIADASNSLSAPSTASNRHTPSPQLQKSNSVRGGRRLVKRSSRPTSPTSADFPSIDSLPFPVATGSANKILMLMKTLCGRMKGEVEYQSYENGPWYPGICYIDDVKGSLMCEGDDSGPFHVTVISDLRGCRITPIISHEKQKKCLEISNPAIGLELLLLPLVKAEYDLWLAALLSWQQIRNGTLSGSPSRASMSSGERKSGLSRQASPHSNGYSTTSSSAPKEGNIIKVAKVLLWDKGAPSSPKAISRRTSTRDLKVPIRTWRKVSCILQDNGEFKLLTENDVTLLSVIQLSQLSRYAIQRLDKSVLGQDFGIAIFPRYTSTSTQLSIFRPVYIALESRLLYEVWFCLLTAFAIPEIYGLPTSHEDREYDAPSLSQSGTGHKMFRVEKSLNVRLVEAKLARIGDAVAAGNSIAKHEQDPSIGEYFAEVILDGEVRARTMTRTETKNPFWREDYEFHDLPAHPPKLSITLKRIDNLVAHRGFLSSSSVHVSNHAEEVVAGTCTIPVEDLERGKDNEAWWPILDEKQQKIGEAFLKLRYDELVVLLAKEYEPLSHLMHNFGDGLTEQIAQVLPSNLKLLAELLMNIFQVSGHAGDWLMALVEDEIDGVGKEAPVRRVRYSKRIGSNESFHSVSDREQAVRDIGKTLQGEANLLFRGNSLFTQAMDFHMRRLGKEYLEEILSEKILEIDSLNPNCEVDPSRVAEGDDASKNWALLISFTTDIWERIAVSASRCSGELRQIFKYIRSVAEDRYGDFLRTVSYTSVSGFLFLRFICPALLNPKLFGILRDHPPPRAQRTLTLIAKSLQALANLTSFGQKEIWMEPMNRFLSSHRQELKDYIDSICAVPADRNLASLPGSYSTPIKILSRLPDISREGFPSLPYLIDHPRNFAALIKLWVDGTARYILPESLEGDLGEFHQICLDLQRRADDCFEEADVPDADRLSLHWEDVTQDFENTKLTDEPINPSFFVNSTPQLSASPPWSETTTTITSGEGLYAHGSETRERERKERQRFWESAFRKDGKDEDSDARPSSRGASMRSGRSFLSGLRKKGRETPTQSGSESDMPNTRSGGLGMIWNASAGGSIV